MKTQTPLFAKLILLLVTIIWGSGYVVAEYAIRTGINLIWILAIRFWTAGLFIGALLVCKRKKPVFRSLKHGATAGIILFLALYAEMVGQSKTVVSNAAIITSASVIIVPYLVWLFSRRRPSKKTFFYSFLAMIGVCLLSIVDNAKFVFHSGDILILVGAFLFAFQIVWIGLFCVDDCPEQVAFSQMISAGLCSLIVIMISGESTSVSNLKQILLPTIYLGLFPTGLCYFLQSYAEQYAKATDAAIIFSAEGLFGTIFSLALGLEEFRWVLVPGASLILISIFMVCADASSKDDTS